MVTPTDNGTMTEYKNVEKMSGELLEIAVNERIEEGLKAKGGLQIEKDGHLDCNYRAMVRD